MAEVDTAARIPELLSRAFHVATSGRPGPVVLALPEDMLRETASVSAPTAFEPIETYPGLTQTAQLQKLLWAAKKPFVIAGGGRWSDKAVAALRRFAERFELPVGVSFRRQGLFDHDHPNYAGDVGLGINPALARRIKEADLLLLFGGRMSETPSNGYTLIETPEPRQALVHVHAGAEELGRVYRPTLAINATPNGFASQLEVVHPPVTIPWSVETRAANAAYRAWSDPAPRDTAGVELGAMIRHLRDTLPDDAIVTNGAGNYAGWLHRYYRYRRPGTQLAPTSGSMGYGLPAAIAAKLRHPGRTVVALAGDGCFQMTGQEFATAAQEGAAVIVIVVDNGMYGTIRAHQERAYPGPPGRDRPHQSRLCSPRQGLWRPWRDRRDDRRLRRRLRPRRRLRQTGAPPCEGRPRGDLAEHDDQRAAQGGRGLTRLRPGPRARCQWVTAR